MQLLMISTTVYSVMLARLPEGALGEADPKAQMITIAPDQAPHRFVDTLLHEALHAFLYETGQQDRKFTEEELCTVGGCALTSLFVANPLLLPALHNLLRGDIKHVGPDDLDRAFASARKARPAP
jgi:hypothetical protein